MGGFNLQDLMSKAKAQYESLQKKMQETVVEATSGGGTVTAKMDGRKQLLSLRIDPEAVKAGDVEMLQDLVLAAINEAARKIDASDEVYGRRHAGRNGHSRPALGDNNHVIMQALISSIAASFSRHGLCRHSFRSRKTLL